MKYYLAFKYGFGGQFIVLANALRLYEKAKVKLEILEGIPSYNTFYNYSYSSILLDYLNIAGIEYINKNNCSNDLNELFYNPEYNNSVFNGTMNIPNSMFIVKPPVFMKNFIISRCIGDNLQYTNPYIISRYSKLRNIDSFMDTTNNANKINNLHDRIGIHIRLFPEHRIEDSFTYNNSNIWTVLKYLRDSRNEKFYICVDNFSLYNKLNLCRYIHSSHDIIYDYDDNYIDETKDILNKDTTAKSQKIAQLKALQCAINLCHCKQFIGTIRSGYSKVFVPSLYLMINGEKDEKKREGAYNKWLFKNSKCY